MMYWMSEILIRIEMVVSGVVAHQKDLRLAAYSSGMWVGHTEHLEMEERI